MRRINIAEPAFDYDDEDPAGFRAGMARLGKGLGAEQTGATVYELAPGEAVCPYHYELGEEEWLLVLSGEPTVRHPEGSDRLVLWDLVMFPRGPDGAHQIRNEGDEPARVLMFSNFASLTATVYPDSDKLGIWTGDPDVDLLVRRDSGVGYYDGET